MCELWDCYDKDFNKIPGKVLIRGQEASFSPDEYHLVCDITVRHRDGSYLLMQRDHRKKGYPGKWELTAGGSALQGETPLLCANRELLEETGLVADELHKIGKMAVAANHSIYVIYLATISGNKDAVTLQEGETINFKWVSKVEVYQTREELATWRIFDLLPSLDWPTKQS